jgi:DNA-directed RNA polymerase specialized sigma24 family protein
MNDRDAAELLRLSKAQLLVALEMVRPEDERTDRQVVLRRAGFNAREIADMLGKQHGAVRKYLLRTGKGA